MAMMDQGTCISKSDQQFQRRRFLKNCLKNSISLPWQVEFLMESNSVNTFQKGPPKEHSCQVWSKLAQRFGRRHSKKSLATRDGHQVILTNWDKKIFNDFLLYLYVRSKIPQHRASFHTRAIICNKYFGTEGH